MSKIQNTKSSVDDTLKQQKSSFTAGEKQNGAAIWKADWKLLTKLKILIIRARFGST